MTRDPVTTTATTSVEAVILLMLNKGLSRLPVVDAELKPVGIISKTDLVADRFQRGDTSELSPDDDARIPQRGGVSYAARGFHLHEPDVTVADVMQPSPITVTESTPVAKAAELMATHHLHGLPVLSSSGRVTGMLSSLDLVGWLAGLQ